jgi:hypothetical protein
VLVSRRGWLSAERGIISSSLFELWRTGRLTPPCGLITVATRKPMTIIALAAEWSWTRQRSEVFFSFDDDYHTTM